MIAAGLGRGSRDAVKSSRTSDRETPTTCPSSRVAEPPERGRPVAGTIATVTSASEANDGVRNKDPDARSCRDWTGHVVVCGLEDVGLRTVEQLHHAGAKVAVLEDGHDDRFAT